MLSPQINIVRASADSSANKRSQSGSGSFNSQQGQGLPLHFNRFNRNSGSNTSSTRGSPTVSPRSSISDRKRTRDDVIALQWPDKPMDKAPELNLLSKRESSSGLTGDCISKLFRLVSTFCKNLNRVGDVGLSNFKQYEDKNI